MRVLFAAVEPVAKLPQELETDAAADARLVSMQHTTAMTQYAAGAAAMKRSTGLTD